MEKLILEDIKDFKFRMDDWEIIHREEKELKIVTFMLRGINSIDTTEVRINLSDIDNIKFYLITENQKKPYKDEKSISNQLKKIGAPTLRDILNRLGKVNGTFKRVIKGALGKGLKGAGIGVGVGSLIGIPAALLALMSGPLGITLAVALYIGAIGNYGLLGGLVGLGFGTYKGLKKPLASDIVDSYLFNEE